VRGSGRCAAGPVSRFAALAVGMFDRASRASGTTAPLARPARAFNERHVRDRARRRQREAGTSWVRSCNRSLAGHGDIDDDSVHR